jgi:hypothetical protein
MPGIPAVSKGRSKARPHRIMLVLTASAGLALGAVACAKAPPAPSASVSGPTTDAGAGGDSRPVSAPGGHGGTSGGTGQRSTGTDFSLALARCMRAHGVPGFPDPGGRVGPGSGADPASPAFQSAINGPCRSVAPAAWVSSGQVSGS